MKKHDIVYALYLVKIPPESEHSVLVHEGLYKWLMQYRHKHPAQIQNSALSRKERNKNDQA